ncbi:MAG: hypothetical protein HQ534_00030 [Armatimonadetes bacterium]|nr:hypothetical protein [Armatimonadota bacterium]
MFSKNIPFIPDGIEINQKSLKEQEIAFLQVFEKIMGKAKEYNVTMRVIGSIAFRIRCPIYKVIEYKNKRYLTDINFVTYKKDIVKVQELFFELGWTENQNVLRLFDDKRRIFYHPEEAVHSDIFIDKLRFCHEIDFRKRLEIDYATISLIDLLLEKLQIVEINKKDIIDIIVLLSQYPVSLNGKDKGYINGSYLAKVCSRDWGWWKTATSNLKKVRELSNEYLEKKQAEILNQRLFLLTSFIEKKPKSWKWKIRSKIGDKMRWYREVEEVERD